MERKKNIKVKKTIRKTNNSNKINNDKPRLNLGNKSKIPFIIDVYKRQFLFCLLLLYRLRLILFVCQSLIYTFCYYKMQKDLSGYERP